MAKGATRRRRQRRTRQRHAPRRSPPRLGTPRAAPRAPSVATPPPRRRGRPPGAAAVGPQRAASGRCGGRLRRAGCRPGCAAGLWGAIGRPLPPRPPRHHGRPRRNHRRNPLAAPRHHRRRPSRHPVLPKTRPADTATGAARPPGCIAARPLSSSHRRLGRARPPQRRRQRQGRRQPPGKRSPPRPSRLRRRRLLPESRHPPMTVLRASRQMRRHSHALGGPRRPPQQQARRRRQRCHRHGSTAGAPAPRQPSSHRFERSPPPLGWTAAAAGDTGHRPCGVCARRSAAAEGGWLPLRRHPPPRLGPPRRRRRAQWGHRWVLHPVQRRTRRGAGAGIPPLLPSRPRKTFYSQAVRVEATAAGARRSTPLPALAPCRRTPRFLPSDGARRTSQHPCRTWPAVVCRAQHLHHHRRRQFHRRHHCGKGAGGAWTQASEAFRCWAPPLEREARLALCRQYGHTRGAGRTDQQWRGRRRRWRRKLGRPRRPSESLVAHRPRRAWRAYQKRSGNHDRHGCSCQSLLRPRQRRAPSRPPRPRR